MKQLLYLHARMRPLALVLTQACYTLISRRVAPLLLRLMPGERGRKISLVLLWFLGLLSQALMLWLLGELVTLCIGLYELWAILAGRFVAIDN